MTSLCEKTGHLIRLTKTDRGSGDQYAHCQICGCAVVKGSWNTPWKQHDAQENAIVFAKEGGEWVMRITQDCISVNDNVSTDDAAEAVVAAIGRYLNKSKWVGLTDEELRQCIGIGTEDSDWNVAVVQEWLRKVEAKLKEKNCA